MYIYTLYSKPIRLIISFWILFVFPRKLWTFLVSHIRPVIGSNRVSNRPLLFSCSMEKTNGTLDSETIEGCSTNIDHKAIVWWILLFFFICYLVLSCASTARDLVRSSSVLAPSGSGPFTPRRSRLAGNIAGRLDLDKWSSAARGYLARGRYSAVFRLRSNSGDLTGAANRRQRGYSMDYLSPFLSFPPAAGYPRPG